MTRRGVPTIDAEIVTPGDLDNDEFARQLGDRVLAEALDKVARASDAPTHFDFLLSIERSRPFVIRYRLWTPLRAFAEFFSREILGFLLSEWGPCQRFDALGRRHPQVAILGRMVPYRVVMRDRQKPLCTPLLDREMMKLGLPLTTDELVLSIGLAVNDRAIDFGVGKVSELDRKERDEIELIAFSRRGRVTDELLNMIELDPHDHSVWRMPPARYAR